MILDPLCALLAMFAGYGVLALRGITGPVAGSTGIMTVVVAIVGLGLLARSGQYTTRRRLSVLSDIGTLVWSLVVAAAVAALFSYLSKGFFMGNAGSRGAGLVFFGAFLALGMTSRIILRSYQQRLFARGEALRRILVVGTGAAATDLVQFVTNRPWLGVVPAGVVRCNGHNETPVRQLTLEGGVVMNAPVVDFAHSLEGLKSLDGLLRSSGATEVVVALDEDEQDHLPAVAELLTLAHVPFKVVPSLFEQTFRTTELLGYAELPVVEVEVDPLDRVARIFKRALDICVASAALVALLPLELGIVLAITAESGFPFFYKSRRVGKNGKPFCMYKFRTMAKDADARFAEIEAQNELSGCDGLMFKMKRDPRVTRVGACLRTFSLDEWPQFVNVLRGEMSVVGPRPPLPREVDNYEREHLYRLRATPGITGMWQISGRSDLGFEDMVRLDRYYLDNWSVKLDLQIIFKTVLVVLGRKGAY